MINIKTSKENMVGPFMGCCHWLIKTIAALIKNRKAAWGSWG
jgi:hypothetical protein